MSTRACAISGRNPFGLSLNVGGNSENRAKSIVNPAAAAPSRVTVKTLFTSPALLEGVSSAATCVHSVWEPEMGTVAEAMTSPEDDCSAIVASPLKLDSWGTL